MNARWIMAACVTVLSLTAGLALADEQAIRRAVSAQISDAKILEVRRLPYGDLYEVVYRGPRGVGVVYADGTAKALLGGPLIDLKSGENLTEGRVRKLTAIDWKVLPMQWAITSKRGAGRREIAVFSDPNCPYCKRFEEGLATLDDVTVYIFPYPVIKPESVRQAKGVWCSKDRLKAWNDMMFRRIEPKAKPDCDTPIDQLVTFGNSLGATSTPTWFLRNGEMRSGNLPMAELVKLMDAATPRGVGRSR